MHPDKKKLLKKAVLCVPMCVLLVAAIAFLRAKHYAVPVLMYHHVIAEDADPQNAMIVTASRLREDFTFLRDNGYTALLPADLVRIRAGEQTKPKKPIMITFDDGYQSNFTLAYPLLRETNMKAVIAVIAGSICADEQEHAYMLTWGQCREMYESGIVDIGSHTFDLHNGDNGGNPYPAGADGIQRKPLESRADYRARVGGDLHASVAAIEQNVGNDCIYFSYPFGADDAWFSELLAREGVRVTTTTMQRGATLVFGTQRLPRYRVTMATPLSDCLR